MARVIQTRRLAIRPARPGDSAGLIELATDPRVRRYLGGPKPAPVADAQVGAFLERGGADDVVVTVRPADELIGTVGLQRRDRTRPGHVRDEGGELELSYVFRPACWGQGYAYEATSALLASYAAHHEDELVVLVTQTGNVRSLALAARLGFEPLDTFEEFGERQSLCTAWLHSFV